MTEINDEERRAILMFLNRTDLKGHEVPVYNAIMRRLTPERQERKEVKEDGE